MYSIFVALTVGNLVLMLTRLTPQWQQC